MSVVLKIGGRFERANLDICGGGGSDVDADADVESGGVGCSGERELVSAW